tara:strand:- start:155 stop:1393 length:1239 start_codon:yes stop_codon:yes gene_type:complete
LRDSIESIATRSISILSKFFLIGFLIKELTLSDYGNFQLISYFILFSTTIFGLEYYNISNRDIVSSSDKHGVYSFHFNFFLTTLSILIVVHAICFYTILPTHLTNVLNFILVFFIGIFDYISQEIYRYLMINKKFRKANLQLIYKSFFFLIFVIGFRFLFHPLDFNNILLIMLLSYFLLLILAILTFNKTLFSIKELKIEKLSFKKVKEVLYRLAPFLTLILFVKGIEFSDKFILGKTLGSKDVGIYSFLYTMGSVINIFIVSGFYLIYLPELIAQYKTDKTKFNKIILKFSKLNIGFSFLLVFFIKITENIVIELTGKTELLEYTDLLTLILIGFVLFNLSLIPHIYLYVSKNEKSIMYTMGFALILNVLLTICFIKIFGIFGVAYSFIGTYIFILVSKSLIGYKKWKQSI